MSYVKKYDVGGIRLDAPYTHFLYELPLLSFSDVQGSVGVSLVFHSGRNNNPFNISIGYKLNLQKRLILTSGGNPEKLEDGNGRIIDLISHGDRFTFDDDSQRIIRPYGNGFSLENPDCSKEIYDNLGRITHVYDKYGNAYLTYSYINSKLDSITYGDHKVIKLNYFGSLGMLESMQYICDGTTICTTSLVYTGSANVTVYHYSGVN